MDVIRAFYWAKDNTIDTVTNTTFVKWREIVGDELRPNMNANRLANTRRDILKNKRLTEIELDNIKLSINEEIPENGTNEPELAHNLNNEEIHRPIDPVAPDAEAADQNITQLPEPLNEEENAAIKEAEQDIIRYVAIITNTDMESRRKLPKFQLNREKTEKLKLYNSALKKILVSTPELTLSDLNTWIYATAISFSDKCNILPQDSERRESRKGKKKWEPSWKIRMDKCVNNIWTELSIIQEVSKGTCIKSRKSKRVMKKFGIYSKDQINTINETQEILKQKLMAKAQRRRRITSRCKFYRQNKLFQNDTKRFYRELGGSTSEIKNPPKMKEVTEFWKNIWAKPVEFEQRTWLEEGQQLPDTVVHKSSDISVLDVQKALLKAQKWKAPGIDKVPNFWLHHLSCTHQYLAKAFNNIIDNPDETPEWLTNGITFLIPKNDETAQAKNYRPITCLSTTYKLLTAIISDSIYSFLDVNKIFPIEQKGCKRGAYGCKDQLLINSMINEDCKTKKKNMSAAWVDYRKAFDSVSHSWIVKCLELYNIDNKIIKFLKRNMTQWKTALVINHQNGSEKSTPINIRRGIFQGDSLSPLLFCMALFPLSKLIKRHNYGYKCHGKTISHLFYMDDLKLFAKNDKELRELMNIVKSFSDTIKMQFNAEKCAKVSVKRGKYLSSENIILDTHTTIKELSQYDVYKYLGVVENVGISHKK